jgi:hypothetical protein
MKYTFFRTLTNILDAGKSRSVVLTGNINDLFFDGDEFVPLINFLIKKCQRQPTQTTRGVTVVIYETNRSLQVVGDEEELRKAWNTFKGLKSEDRDSFDDLMTKSVENPTLVIEFLRQLTLVSRQQQLKTNLVILIEGTEMLIPVGQIATLSMADRKRISIFQDWFSDPGFMNGHDSVVLFSESRSSINPFIGMLPQLLSVEIPAPDAEARTLFSTKMRGKPIFVEETAGLTLHAYRQLLCEGEVAIEDVIAKVAEFVSMQLGEDVVDFKRPTHTLDKVVGFHDLKEYLRVKLIPRLSSRGDDALSGFAVSGPIGVGKTFTFEALAAELGMPVLELKNIRSQWFGQTDVILERLRRIISALDKVAIFVDEADTQFGGLDANVHETERRATGKIQAMMSDPVLRKTVRWILMSARIHRLSPDIRRPGRVGDLIIPMLDPEGEDRNDFCKWVLKAAIENFTDDDLKAFQATVKDYSAAQFSALRSELKAEKPTTIQGVVDIAADMLPADIGETRRYQTLQGLLNCTRRSLIPDHYLNGKSIEEARNNWRSELATLEAKGIN